MSEIIASTYEIIEKLGSGGGGNVYLAKHLRLGIRVVLKADKRKLSTDLSLLRREVDILKELNYPGIPRVQDFFAVGEFYRIFFRREDDGIFFPFPDCFVHGFQVMGFVRIMVRVYQSFYYVVVSFYIVD